MSDPKKIYFSTETSKFETLETDGQKKIILSGVALPFDKISRNGVKYRTESIKAAFKSLEKAAFLFNHDSNVPIGHVVSSGITNEGMTYEADIDPAETDYIRKIERGDIRHVSIGALVANPEYDEKTDTVTVDIAEFVELSAAPVPGFKDATATVQYQSLDYTPLMIAETFGNTEMIEKIKAKETKKKEEICPVCGKDPCVCEKDKESDGQNDDGEDSEKDAKKAEPKADEKVEVKQEIDSTPLPEADKPEDKASQTDPNKNNPKPREEDPNMVMKDLQAKMIEINAKLDDQNTRIGILESRLDANEAEEEREGEQEKPEPKEAPEKPTDGEDKNTDDKKDAEAEDQPDEKDKENPADKKDKDTEETLSRVGNFAPIKLNGEERETSTIHAGDVRLRNMAY